MTTDLKPDYLRQVLLQTPAYENAQAILNDEWGERATANPLYQAPITVSDLQFAAALQAAGLHAVTIQFDDYGAVNHWIEIHRSSLSPNSLVWLRRPFE